MPFVRMKPSKYYKEHEGGSVFNAEGPVARSLVENGQADWADVPTPTVVEVETGPTVVEIEAPPEPEPVATEDTEPEATEEAVDDAEDDFPTTQEELQAMGKKALREIAGKAGIDTAGMKKKAIVAAILAQ